MRSQGQYCFGWATASTPRTDATAVPSLHIAGHGLRLDGLAERLDELETIDPRPLPLWRTESFMEIEVGSDRETAREWAETARSISAIMVYSDALGREGHLGAAAVVLNNNLEVIESYQVQVGLMDRWLVHVAELISIFYAISIVFKISYQQLRTDHYRIETVTILCDSKSAL